MTVLGLVDGWGDVALHGDEGFRAAWASIVVLFSDWVWNAEVQPPNHAERWWRRFTQIVGPWLAPGTPPDPIREQLLSTVARRYAVPLLSLQDALSTGFLGEVGVDAIRREEVRRLLERLRTSRGSGDSGPGNHGASDAA